MNQHTGFKKKHFTIIYEPTLLRNTSFTFLFSRKYLPFLGVSEFLLFPSSEPKNEKITNIKGLAAIDCSTESLIYIILVRVSPPQNKKVT